MAYGLHLGSVIKWQDLVMFDEPPPLPHKKIQSPTNIQKRKMTQKIKMTRKMRALKLKDEIQFIWQWIQFITD